jgi:glycosyltransferase involved in cell wall biosynthesis
MVNISVALVTRNRPESLERTLISLRSQSLQPFEVVISDDSDLNRAHETKEIADRFDCRYASGPRQGLYANRNYVALACEGTHIRTMDDDHIFPAGHFERCLAAVESDARSIWTTGEVGYIDGVLRWEASEANQLIASGVGGAVKNLDNNWAIADGSTIYPREVFDQGHRMVEWFNYGSSYLEFGAYLYQRGFKSRCIRGEIIEHYPQDESIVTRGREFQNLESTLFASLCYNLFFEPNYLLSGWHILRKTMLVNRKSDFFGNVGLLTDRARMRWKGNSDLICSSESCLEGESYQDLMKLIEKS